MLKETAASNLSITGCNRIKHITFACQMFLLSSISRSLFIILKSDCITVKSLFEPSQPRDLGTRGGSRISGKGFHMYKGMGVCFLILSHLSQISHGNETKLFHFHMISKNGGGGGGGVGGRERFSLNPL